MRRALRRREQARGLCSCFGLRTEAARCAALLPTAPVSRRREGAAMHEGRSRVGRGGKAGHSLRGTAGQLPVQSWELRTMPKFPLASSHGQS